MPNIFDGLKNFSDNDIIEQIALLEIMNVTNISKPVIQRAKKKTINIINFIASKIGKNKMLHEPEIKEVWALIDERKEELKAFTRIQLDKIMLEILLEKVKNNIEKETEDEISIAVINEAAKLYKIGDNLLPSKKADIIYSKYNEMLEGKAREYINGQTFVDLQETTKDIEEILNNMDEEQRKQLTQSVDIINLTLLGVWKKLDRQHFIRLIWLCVKAYGGRFTVEKEKLPSFVSEEKENEVLNNELKLDDAQKDLKKLKKQLEDYKVKITTIDNNLEKEKRILKNSVKIKNRSENDFIELQENNKKLAEIKKALENRTIEIKQRMEGVILEELDILMEEFKVVKFKLIDVNNEISNINMQIIYKKELIEKNTKVAYSSEKQIKFLEEEFEKLKNEAQIKFDLYREKRKEVIAKEEEKRNEIFKRWNEAYNKFVFEYSNLKGVIKFSRKELLCIEECFYELENTKDFDALSMGIIETSSNKKDKEEYDYIDVEFDNNFKIEIQFKALKSIEKNIHIVGIYTNY